MRSVHRLVSAFGIAILLGLFVADAGRAQSPSLAPKINAYVGCINRLSERSYDSRARYFSWVGKEGPTGRERIIYGLYTIYDTSGCKKNVEQANAVEPRLPELEAAASAYATAVAALEPLLKEADDYYQQQNYKDDRMAKGRALHHRLVAAWDAFAVADRNLRAGLEVLQAKRVMRAESAAPPDLSQITQALGDYEAMVKATEEYAAANKDSKVGSSFVGAAKEFLTTAKQLMRRVRDKVPYSSGDKMMLDAGSGWMVEGSPARLTRDYNQLVDRYNSGGRF